MAARAGRATCWLVLLVASSASALTTVDFVVELAPGAAHRSFAVEVHPDWAPLGAARFVELVEEQFFDGVAFFRVIGGFMAQFGINGNLTKQKRWKSRAIPDEASPVAAPPRASNARGRLTFAHAGKNTRTTQLFLNFGNNARLDRENFPPFAEVAGGGMAVVDAIHVTGEGAPSGKGPNQGKIQVRGDAYLRAEFPELSRVVSARVRRPEPEPEPAPEPAAPRRPPALRDPAAADAPALPRVSFPAKAAAGAPRAGGGRWYVFLIPASFVLSVFARRYRRGAAPAAAGFDAGDAEDPALSKEN